MPHFPMLSLYWIILFGFLYWLVHGEDSQIYEDRAILISAPLHIHDDEWWRITCIFNSDHGIGSLWTYIYSQSTLLLSGIVDFDPAGSQATVTKYPGGNSSMALRNFTFNKNKEDPSTYKFQIAFKLNGTTFTMSTNMNGFGLDLNLGTSDRAEDVDHIVLTIRKSNIIKCFDYIECYR